MHGSTKLKFGSTRNTFIRNYLDRKSPCIRWRDLLLVPLGLQQDLKCCLCVCVCVQSITHYGTVWHIVTNVWVEPAAVTYTSGAFSSTLHMEVPGFSETLLLVYQTARHHIPSESTLHTRSRDNLESHLRNHYSTQVEMTQNGDIAGDLP